MYAALALTFLLGAADPAPPKEPSLVETQEAAARAAGGRVEEDASRTSRARLAHWAPQLRGQSQLKDDEKSRNGEFRLAPLHEQDVSAGHVWSIVLGWDGTDQDTSTAAIDGPSNAVTGTTISVPVTKQVTLQSGSYTSVAAWSGTSGSELLIPFGLSSDGTSWIDPRGVNVTVLHGEHL